MWKYKIGDMIILREARELKNCKGIGNIPVSLYGGKQFIIKKYYSDGWYEIDNTEWVFSEEMIVGKISDKIFKIGDIVEYTNDLKDKESCMHTYIITEIFNSNTKAIIYQINENGEKTEYHKEALLYELIRVK